VNSLWLLLLPVAATAGYISSARKQLKLADISGLFNKKPVKPKNYLNSLTALMQEEPDKAVDVLVNSIEVDNSTVETHLAIGDLFRKRGEVDRAIRIHQNLVKQINLKPATKKEALFALANDYLSAGVLDRAEKIFLDLTQADKREQASYQSLLDIYQQERDWRKAIEVAQTLAANSGKNMQLPIAQYNCELAAFALRNKDLAQAKHYFQKALTVNSHCARASLGLAEIAKQENQWQKALRFLKHIKTQNSAFINLTTAPLQEAYAALQQPEEFIEYMRLLLDEYPKLPVVVLLSEQIRQLHGDKAALNFVTEHVKKQPSLVGLHDLTYLQLLTKQSSNNEELRLLHDLIHRLLKDQQGYQCVNCGFKGNMIHWQCPSCKQWEAMKPAYLTQHVS
jgi:lipopolysaccharide biosynthesis regulator YciM